jgi:Domain of unknown function (DUF4258)
MGGTGRGGGAAVTLAHMRPPSPYLSYRMPRRKISEEEIVDVLTNPETSYVSESHDDRRVVLGNTSGDPPRPLKVVVLARDPEHVITVAARDVGD